MRTACGKSIERRAGAHGVCAVVSRGAKEEKPFWPAMMNGKLIYNRRLSGASNYINELWTNTALHTKRV